METASIATLDFAAKYGFDLLYNRYQSGRDQILKYQSSPPYAYIVPQAQRDPVAPVELLRRLAFNGLRVHQFNKQTAVDKHEAVTIDTPGLDMVGASWSEVEERCICDQTIVGSLLKADLAVPPALKPGDVGKATPGVIFVP